MSAPPVHTHLRRRRSSHPAQWPSSPIHAHTTPPSPHESNLRSVPTLFRWRCSAGPISDHPNSDYSFDSSIAPHPTGGISKYTHGIGSRFLRVPTNTANSAHSSFANRPASNEYPAQLVRAPSASNELEKRIMPIHKSHLRCGIKVRYQLTQVAETPRAKRSSGGPNS